MGVSRGGCGQEYRLLRNFRMSDIRDSWQTPWKSLKVRQETTLRNIPLSIFSTIDHISSEHPIGGTDAVIKILSLPSRETPSEFLEKATGSSETSRGGCCQEYRPLRNFRLSDTSHQRFSTESLKIPESSTRATSHPHIIFESCITAYVSSEWEFGWFLENSYVRVSGEFSLMRCPGSSEILTENSLEIIRHVFGWEVVHEREMPICNLVVRSPTWTFKDLRELGW